MQNEGVGGRFIPAPQLPEAQPPDGFEGVLWRVEGLLANYGIAMAPLDALMSAVGAVLILISVLWVGGGALARRLRFETDGVIVGSAPGPGTSHLPLVRFVDADGQRRQFQSELRLMQNPSGKRVRVRVSAGHPEIVGTRRSTAVRYVPLPIGVALLLVGLRVFEIPGL
ncbi:MAG: hypothetical protein AAGI34_07580 [Pseudomonadota bacterium]